MVALKASAMLYARGTFRACMCCRSLVPDMQLSAANYACTTVIHLVGPDIGNFPCILERERPSLFAAEDVAPIIIIIPPWKRAKALLCVQWQVLAVQAAVIAVVAAFMYLVRPKKGSTFLIDFYCLRPPNRYHSPTLTYDVPARNVRL